MNGESVTRKTKCRMKNLHRVKVGLMVLTITGLTTACISFHEASMSSPAVLSQNNFKIIGQVTGKSSAVKVLGIGGASRFDILARAKQDLQSYYQLKPGQALTNVVLDFHRDYWLLGSKQVYTIHADIVQFMEANYFKPDTSKVPNLAGKQELDIIAPAMPSHVKFYGYQLDEIVILIKEAEKPEAKIVLLEKDGLTVRYRDSQGKEMVKSLTYGEVQKK